MKEGTTLYVKLANGKRLLAGQIYQGRWVYWTSTAPWMVKYHTWIGFPVRAAHAVWAAGIKEVDIIRPEGSSCWRASVADLVRAPLHTVGKRAQRFLDSKHWTEIDFYPKPDYRAAKVQKLEFPA